MASAYTVTVTEDGPLHVEGDVVLRRMTITPEGAHYRYVDEGVVEHEADFWLCRCGRTETPPFCSNMHEKVGFDGTETFPRSTFASRAKRIEGDGIVLLDDYDMCALARFCHTDKGAIWGMMRRAGDPDVRAEIVKAANECPAGRLVAVDAATGQAIEYDWPNEIVILEDPQRHCSGPLWLRGDFSLVGADGEPYEKSGKYTLCRCGLSATKPLCDSEHAFSHWNEPGGEHAA